jgi:hypothetical protein
VDIPGHPLGPIPTEIQKLLKDLLVQHNRFHIPNILTQSVSLQ